MIKLRYSLYNRLYIGGILLISTVSLATAQEQEQKEQISKEHDTLTVKASIDICGAYDFQNHDGQSTFSPSSIVMKDVDHRKRVIFDIPSATLGIEKVLTLPDQLGKETIKLVVQTKLQKALTLKRLYADYKAFRVGKADSNFCDLDACGLVSGVFVQMRWQHQVRPSLRYAIAIEAAPELSVHTRNNTSNENKDEPKKTYQNSPAVSAHVRYEQKNRRHVQLSGLFRVLEHHDTAYPYIPTWGVQIGASLHAVPERTVFKLQSIYGQGIGSYMADLGDLTKENNTICPVRQADSKQENTYNTLDAWGIGVGVKQQWIPKWQSEFEGRFISTLALDTVRPDQAYKSGAAFSANLFYHHTKQVKIGTEYLCGIRSDVDGVSKDAHRVQAVIGFSL